MSTKNPMNATGATQQGVHEGGARGTSDASMMPGKIPSDKAMAQGRGGGQTSEADQIRHGDVAETVSSDDAFDGPQNPRNQPDPTPGNQASHTRRKR